MSMDAFSNQRSKSAFPSADSQKQKAQPYRAKKVEIHLKNLALNLCLLMKIILILSLSTLTL